MPRLRLALIAVALGMAAPADAQATSRPGLWETLTFENIATGLVQIGLGWARVLADIRYQHMTVDPLASRIVLTELEVSPLISGGSPDACRITTARTVISGAELGRGTNGRFHIAMDDARVPVGCLPPAGAGFLRGLGLRDIFIPRVEYLLTYDYPTGGALLGVTADLDGLANVEISANLDYVSFRLDFDREEPVFAAYLSDAQITVEDNGAWDLARPLLPADLVDPEALGQTLRDAVLSTLSGAGGQPTVPPDQLAFAQAAGRAATRFAKGERLVVLRTDLRDGPVKLDAGTAENPAALFLALQPRLSNTRPAVRNAIAVAELEAALSAETPPENALALGRALATGIGAPRDLASALRLLAPVARAGNAEASLLIAEAVGRTRPKQAYAHALRAAAAGLPGALTVMDRIERDLPYTDVIEAQNALLTGQEDRVYGDLAAMRQLARDYWLGIKRPRSWRAAYYWAAMAAAGGDAGSAALRDEITETLRLRGDGANWAETAASLDSGVLRDWIAKDVPSRLR